MEDDYYQLLGVTRDATSNDIKRAFREIARKCHPDVSGGDAALEERFKQARLAYETLMDPVARARYDRRAQRRSAGGGAPPPGGTFFDAFWKASEKTYDQPSRVHTRAQTGRKNPGNDVSLDDLFDGWGQFGTGGAPGVPGGPGEPASGGPAPGQDVHVELEVPADVARNGGSVTAVYHRLQRSDTWRPGSPDPGVVRIQDLAEIRIVPGTRNGETLRERGLGDAGVHGGPAGDLFCTVRLVAPGRSARPEPGPRPAPPPPRAAPPPPRAAPPEPEPSAPTPVEEEPPADAILDISVVEALLGGRVSVETPQGRVRATIPPCTSSGVRMRLKGKGPPGPDGQPADWFLVTRIVVPASLDAESRRLIEEFARLNP
jgi:curved DNA-binding protein